MDQKRVKWNPIIPYPDPIFEGNVGLDVPIVLDLGSSKTRAGFAGQEYPFCMIYITFDKLMNIHL